MYIGACRLTLHLYDNRSLKGKRRILHSLTDRARRTYGVSIAEVSDQDRWQLATLGFAAVSGEYGTARDLVDRVVRFVTENTPEAEVSSVEVEMFDL